MTRTRFFPALVLGLALGAGVARAQAPLFLDGTAFGGSKVFSQGLSPRGNAARFDQPPSGWYVSYLDGDRRSQDNRQVLDDLGIGGTARGLSSDDLRRLSQDPWGERTEAFGVALLAMTGNASFTHEDHRSFMARVDGAGTTADRRRSIVDRAALGVGSFDQGSGYGLSLRLEHWRMGQETLALSPAADQQPLSGSPDPLGFPGLDDAAWTAALDLGFLYELRPGLLAGATLDRLNQKHFWDVYERPQLRVGLQVDLGERMQLALESDVNAAARMPFPEPQRTAAASFRIRTAKDSAVILGLERTQMAGSTTLKGGITATFKVRTMTVGLGFQLSQDKPLKGLVMAVE